MKDPVIESYLRDFASDYKKSHLGEAEQFEHFANYCVMAKHYTEAFDPDDVAIGGGGDLGIDGVGIFVNDHLVRAPSDIDYLKKTLRRLDVEFVFVQSKTSASFDGGDIGTFLAGVRCFFETVLPDTANSDVREAHKIKEYIYSLTIDMDQPPICHLHYVTTGIWKGESALETRIDQSKRDLVETGLFSKVEFTALDGERLKRIYREIKHKFIRELSFEKHTILPEIAGVTEAYIGVIPALEYLKILCDDDGVLNRRLFYDNVRDFQGHNTVNSEIRATIVEQSQRDRFSLLNNGVTIVAKDATKIGAKFKLRDYQVVNGCQTSHVLYHSRAYLSDNIFLPIKLIVTNDLDVTNQIIQGANRQTEIKPEAFESLAPFQKELEETYIAIGNSMGVQIAYERRSKQYEDSPISRDTIVTLPAQIKCFVAMFLNEPHSTHRYYGELLEAYRSRLFNESHRFLPYVTSGVALAAMERLFTEEKLPRSMKGFRFQMLMGFRILYGKGGMPALNSKSMDDYCIALIKVVTDEKAFIQALQEVYAILQSVRSKGNPWKEPPERTRSFTLETLSRLSSNGAEEQPRTDRFEGTVTEYSKVKGFGYVLSSAAGGKVFFHQSDTSKSEMDGIAMLKRVSFVIAKGDRGNKAVDLRLLS